MDFEDPDPDFAAKIWGPLELAQEWKFDALIGHVVDRLNEDWPSNLQDWDELGGARCRVSTRRVGAGRRRQ